MLTRPTTTFFFEEMMSCFNSDCVCNSDFERVVFYARKRFIEGVDTLTLMTQARNEQERREVSYAALLDLDEEVVNQFQLFTCHGSDGKASSYRQQLQQRLAALQNQTIGF